MAGLGFNNVGFVGSLRPAGGSATGPPPGYPGFVPPADGSIRYLDAMEAGATIGAGWFADTGSPAVYPRNGLGAYNYQTTDPVSYRLYGDRVYVEAPTGFGTGGTLSLTIINNVTNAVHSTTSASQAGADVPGGANFSVAVPAGDYRAEVARVSGVVAFDGIGFKLTP